MFKKRKFLILGVLCLALAAFAVLAASRDREDPRPIFGHAPLTITRADGRNFVFKTEIALSPDEQAYGLMFLSSLPTDAGMVFPYNSPREVAFWMKNTLIPLDMLFIRPDGTVARIVAEAKPLDVTPIASGEPVIAVVEIKGGQAKQDGFAVGDKVNSPAISPVP